MAGASADVDAGVTLRGARVTLRPWCDADLAPFAAINADPRVMAHFVAPLTREQSDASAGRVRAAMAAQGGWGWWALDLPGIGFAGFTGLSRVAFAAWFNPPDRPVIEVGWRLDPAAWGRGYATEAARLALAYAFDTLGERSVFAFTAPANLASQRVMARLGMRPAGNFGHPRIAVDHPLHRHLLFRADR
jgi:RimJ/RimL family protein N-acetyltransferase